MAFNEIAGSVPTGLSRHYNDSCSKTKNHSCFCYSFYFEHHLPISVYLLCSFLFLQPDTEDVVSSLFVPVSKRFRHQPSLLGFGGLSKR